MQRKKERKKERIILSKETDSNCRHCQQFDETIDNVISACPILAKE
jgi:BRCT domain type II-containing protein